MLIPADVIDGFVVNHERTVAVLESGVRGQDRVVRLHYCCRYLQVSGHYCLGILTLSPKCLAIPCILASLCFRTI